MKKRLLIVCSLLVLFPAWMWGQLPLVPGTAQPERSHHPHKHRKVNFGVKGGFTSSLFLASNLVINGVTIDEIQNNYKIGYFGSFFARINMKRHFLQPEISYTINRCNITFEKPIPGDAPESTIPEIASITSSIHSVEVPLIYGYNIIKEGPYSFALFVGPKIRYVWDGKSEVTFQNFDQQDIQEELYPLNISLTTGVAITISRMFFDFRYDLGLHNISKRISYKPIYGVDNDEITSSNQISFSRREYVLSFSLGIFF